MAKRYAAILVGILLWTSVVSAEFVAGPAVSGTVGGYEISFTLAKPTDVTVRILDGKGTVVRHLASGMVGLEKAAKPFAPKTLSQKITWDGKDGAGKPVDPAGCKVSVATGMRAKFDKFILWSPDAFARMAPKAGIAVGSKGELYMANGQGIHYATLRVLDRDGKYVRCEYPFSPATKGTAEFYKRKKWSMVDYEGNEVPKSINHQAAYVFTVHSYAMAANRNGFAIGGVIWGRRATWVVKDGHPFATKQMPWGAGLRAGHMAMCVGPDDDFYIVDPGAGILGRLSGKTLEPVKSFLFAGKTKLPESASYIKTSAALHSVAVDAKGRIWGSHSKGIDVLAADGKLIKRIENLHTDAGDVKARGLLGANVRTGAVYVWTNRHLYKLDSHENPKVIAQHALPRTWGNRTVAVDSESNVIWLLNGAGRHTLLRLVDHGNRFDSKIIKGPRPRSLVYPRYLAAGGDGSLYVCNSGMGSICKTDVEGKAFKAITASGELGGNMPTGNICSDANGNVYTAVSRKWGATEAIEKYGPDGKRLKIGGNDHITMEKDVRFIKGMWVVPGGDIYVSATLRIPDDQKRKVMHDIGYHPFNERHLLGRVDVYGPDGALKKKGIVKLLSPNGVAVARDGSVYTVEVYLHHGAHKMRKYWGGEFGGRFKEPEKWWYSLQDKLLKFPPSGGEQWEEKKDAEWAHPGISGTNPYTCNVECTGAQISVDADDRVWCHDAVVYNVKALDAAGNLMLRVGVYGNEDCKGGGGDRKLPGTNIVVDPEIPLARPSGVAVWKDFLFISDEFSGRIVRCKLEYTEAKAVPVKVQAVQ